MATDPSRARRSGHRRRQAGSKSARGAARSGSQRLGLIGRDVGGGRGSLSARRILPIGIAVLVVSLGVAALRIELLRVRYALGEATLVEQRLLDEERSLTARRRQLRDPVHLARRASGLGFVQPEHLVDLVPRTTTDEPVLAAVSAPPARGASRP